MAGMKRLLLATAVLLALSGCDEYPASGEITIGFGTGFVYYQSSGWSTETYSTSLTVTAYVQPHGDAQVESGMWVVIDTPPGASPILSNPFSPTTLITFPTSGIYQLEYRVDWRLDTDHYSSAAPVEFIVYPTAAG